MRIVLNGESYDCGEASKLISLLEEMAVNAERVATMINGEVIAKEDREDALLKEGDRVEVVTFAGGG